jgi:hypothetical protein
MPEQKDNAMDDAGVIEIAPPEDGCSCGGPCERKDDEGSTSQAQAQPGQPAEEPSEIERKMDTIGEKIGELVRLIEDTLPSANYAILVRHDDPQNRNAEYAFDIINGDYRRIGELYGHGKFDVVTLNPPYREPGTGAISPTASRAGARHELAGSLEEAINAAAIAVKYGGRVAVVFLAERLTDLLVALRAAKLEPKRLRLIQPRAGRPANLLLLEAVKGGGAGLKVEPSLTVYAEGQTYTAEMQAIYDA